MSTRIRHIALIAIVIGAACGGDGETADTSPPATTTNDSAGGAHNMPGMGGADLSASMRQHLSMMQGMNADSMKAMMPEHRQMAANLLAEMTQQMRSMNMTGDSAWNAVTDSIRQDLTRMPDLSAAELHAFMTEHHRRLTRLMDMHTTMMKNMRM